MPITEHPVPKIWRRRLGLALIPAMFSACAVFLLWRSHPDPAYWQSLAQAALDQLAARPWALLLALATLPGLGFPVSPLLILAGITIAPRYGMATACLLGILAQSVCTTWTFLLASGPLRAVITRYVRKRRELPVLTEANKIRIGLILRITPGIPYALQNVALGILGMRIGPYLAVSIPITALWSTGFIVTGGALFEGRAGLAISGVLLLLVLIAATKMLTRKNIVDDG
ncbi:MAG: hypothetical protein ACLFU4_05680 [Opitutales bacterium]